MTKRWLLLGVVAVVAQSSSSRAAPPAAAAKASERRLHVASAEASSYLVNDWNKFQENYLPLYVGDDDPRTAWTLKTEGIGEWLRVHVTPMVGATKVRLQVRNGYQKTDKLWAANSRAHGLTVVLLPSKKTVDVDLTDKQGWQEIAVEQPAGPFEAVELRVRSVYAGKKYDDLCLSDVQVFVTATSADNPAFEKQRLQKILDWKKDRVAAAAMFKTTLGQALPVAAQYVVTSDAHDGDGPGTKCRDDLCFLREELARAQAAPPNQKPSPTLTTAAELTRAGFSTMTPVKVSTRDKRPMPLADGVCTAKLGECFEDPCETLLPLPGQIGFLNAASVMTIEQKGLPSATDVLALKPPQCHRAAPTTFGYVARDAAAADGTPGGIRALLLITCGAVEEREGSFPMARPELLVYGDDGLLEVLASRINVAALEWTHDPAGPRLARGRVTNLLEKEPRSFEAATAVAGK